MFRSAICKFLALACYSITNNCHNTFSEWYKKYNSRNNFFLLIFNLLSGAEQKSRGLYFVHFFFLLEYCLGILAALLWSIPKNGLSCRIRVKYRNLSLEKHPRQNCETRHKRLALYYYIYTKPDRKEIKAPSFFHRLKKTLFSASLLIAFDRLVWGLHHTNHLQFWKRRRTGKRERRDGGSS